MMQNKRNKDDKFNKNLKEWVQFLSWARWNYDLFLDLITPETGGIRLDLDQRVFLRSLGRFIRNYGTFPRGYGKCVTGDTILFTEIGMVEIGEFFNYQNNNIETYYDPKIKLLNRYSNLVNVQGGVYSGFKKTKKITTEEGYQIETSLNHPLLIKNNNGEFIWKKAEDLKIGDCLCINRNNNIWGNNKVVFDKINNNEIPKNIMKSSKNIVKKYIQALFDTYGEVKNDCIWYTTCSEKMSKQLQIVLLNFGIISERKEINLNKYIIKIDKNNLSYYYKEISFSNTDKQNKLKYILKNSKCNEKFCKYYLSKIKVIQNSKSHTYDLHVPDSNSFIGNGFVNHNTFIELLGVYITAILFPDCNLSMSAQTREASAKLIKEKHKEIIKFYPLIENEIVGKPSLQKEDVEIVFTSGSRITNLANNQSSKGLRRHRLNMEEAALINDMVYQDCLEPIPNIPRRTIGKKSLINPYELNGQINFLTTSYFKGTEYERSLKMVDEMANLQGSMVLGADWQLACKYGRGETETQILAKKEKLSPIFFATNYESRWIGNTDNCLVDIDKMMDLRVLPKAELKGDGKSEYYICADIARSTKTSNNQTSISVGKVKRDKNEKVKKVQLVNLINLPNGLNFTSQAIILKRLKNIFKAKKVIIDGNGLGVGLVDELLKSHIDPITGEELIAYETINTDHESDELETDKCLFIINAQGINSDIIVNFISMIESKKLQLLEKIDQNEVDYSNNDYMKNELLSFIQTDFLIEEVANLQLKTLNGGKLTVERNTKKMDKDRYSSCAYLLYYIMTYENKTKEEKSFDFTKLLQFKKPEIYHRK